jgi:hypothetical protein
MEAGHVGLVPAVTRNGESNHSAPGAVNGVDTER